LALISPALWSIVNIIDDNLVKKVYKNPFYGPIITGYFSLLPLLSIFFVPFVAPDLKVTIFALLSGFFLVCSYWFYYKSFLHEVPSVVLAIWNITSIFVPILAFIFLGEFLEVTQYIGFFIILGSSFTLSLIGTKKIKISIAFPLMIAASFFYAINATMLKYVFSNGDFWSNFLITTMGMGLGALFFSTAFKNGRKIYSNLSRLKKYILIFIISDVINIGAILVQNLAISKGPVSLVRVIEGVQPIYLLILAFCLYPIFPKYFREATQGNLTKKIFLMIIMISGLYLINK